MAAGDDSIRHVRVLGEEYRLDRVEGPTGADGQPDKRIQACWEGLMEPSDWASRFVVNALWDGTYEPSALPGSAQPTFAGAAAAEILIRRIQREHWQTVEQAKKFRTRMITMIVPAVAVGAFAIGFIIGVL